MGKRQIKLNQVALINYFKHTIPSRFPLLETYFQKLLAETVSELLYTKTENRPEPRKKA